MSDRKVLTLYLAGWQKRMVMDYVKSATPFKKVKVSIIDKKQWVMYRQPIFEGVNKGAWNLYLTDEQISKVVAALGIKIKISALNVSPELVKSGAIAFE